MNIVKKYTNGEIIVVWQPALCEHAGVCAKSLPKVFAPQRKPWVELEHATTQEIVDVVSRCPSGALSILRNPEVRIEVEDDGRKGRFAIYENEIYAGEMTFTWAGESKFIIDHTGVEEAFGGKGFGRKLVKAGVDYAREHGVKIFPLCPFARKEFLRHEEYQDVRA